MLFRTIATAGAITLAGAMPAPAQIVPRNAPQAVQIIPQITHDGQATSSYRVTIAADGTVDMQVRNSRLVPYVLHDGSTKPRLATVTAEVHSSTDAEGIDPASRVAVSVDDLSAGTPRRLASFSAPGADARIVQGRYADVWMPGCCAGPVVHHVHALETGTLLFQASGEAVMGASAWIEAPNTWPAIVRWAAFSVSQTPEEVGAGRLGVLRYGTPAGGLAAATVMAKASKDAVDLVLQLGGAAQLSWLGPKVEGPGDWEAPATAWMLNQIGASDPVGGFQIVLTLGNRRLAVIPVANDRLLVDQASVAHDIILRDGTAR